ncbi:hypothetical protein [Allocoleopsis sp.]|uniref:hypothetical protein n=1 Tax=Allocoleopsis sp. TaxID=3088169 RepID=UPI002FD1CFB2
MSPDIYEEALARTWLWFGENFHRYDPEQASFVTWFNNKLKWVIREVIREQAVEQGKRIQPPKNSDGEAIDLTDFFPAPALDHWDETLQEWMDLVQQDPGKQLRNCRMRDYPQINCQTLLLQILTALRDLGEVSWDELAQGMEVNKTALINFCRSRCSSCFRQLFLNISE